jgi:threonine/homoserine/homoserine lactone efflux protein
MTFVPNPLILPIGFVIGVIVALPLGPINLLGLQRAVERGYFGGLAVGLGILLGDGLIALAAGFGVKALSGAIADYLTVIQIIGGLALMVAGAKLIFVRPQIVTSAEAAKASLLQFIWDVPAAFLLTITNPGAVLGLLAMFSGVSAFVEVTSNIDVFTMAAAVMAGSFSYWVVVSRLISRVRSDIDADWLIRISRIAGLVLFAFGGVLIAEMAIKQLANWIGSARG